MTDPGPHEGIRRPRVDPPRSVPATTSARTGSHVDSQVRDQTRPVIVAYAGRRSGSIAGDLDALAERVRGSLEALRPTALVGAAADGGDLMVLQAGLGLNPPPIVHLVLPTALEVFVEDSVEPGWRGRFDAVVEAVRMRGGTLRELGLSAGVASYRQANQAFLDTATSLASEAETVVLVVASPAGTPSEDGHVEQEDGPSR
jgi:hypothetical protein